MSDEKLFQLYAVRVSTREKLNC